MYSTSSILMMMMMMIQALPFFSLFLHLPLTLHDRAEDGAELVYIEREGERGREARDRIGWRWNHHSFILLRTTCVCVLPHIHTYVLQLLRHKYIEYDMNKK